MKKIIDYQKEKAFGQKYTDDELIDSDIDEINENLFEFIDVLREIDNGNLKGEIL